MTDHLRTVEELETLAVRLASRRRLSEASSNPPSEVSAIVAQLNAIRSGRSFKEHDVRKQLERYCAALTRPERSALIAYLKGLAQVLSGQVEAGAAEDPREAGIETKSVGKHMHSIKPNVVRREPSAAPISSNVVPKVAASASSAAVASNVPVVPRAR